VRLAAAFTGPAVTAAWVALLADTLALRAGGGVAQGCVRPRNKTLTLHALGAVGVRVYMPGMLFTANSPLSQTSCVRGAGSWQVLGGVGCLVWCATIACVARVFVGGGGGVSMGSLNAPAARHPRRDTQTSPGKRRLGAGGELRQATEQVLGML
jgi:hypothetical protein